MKPEFYIKNNELIGKYEWEKIIFNMKKSIKAANKGLDNKNKALQLLSNELVKAIENRLPDEKFGILFSGGVDSSLIALIAKKAGKDFICYTVGFQEGESKEPEDVVYARKAAKELGVEVRVKIINLEQAHELFKKTVKILGKQLNNVINAGVGGVELACIEMAKNDNIKILFSGLGSEEIFAGYQRHKEARDKQEECWRGLIVMSERDLLRDFAVASSQNITFSTPFLDKALVEFAMKIPDKFKIDNDRVKIILREAAESLGLKKEIAWRRKLAAQYGSRLDSAIAKLAKKKGFEYKIDYLRGLQ
ncbi:asparagine synthase C-terminal domain-containing protein [Candidatus Woesearchaeota archaeon]|nr:asparagine synthase C-terminal domain-containing protein [Candidatus Woesearchaeota archaeon]